jgi:hypothetical protein
MDVQLEHYPDEQGEEDNLKLKNAASERIVPVHPELERLGFIRFVGVAKEAKPPSTWWSFITRWR